MVKHGIDIPTEQIADFCRRNHIRKLSLFGSILRDDFGPESDVDMLVEFEPDHRIGYLGLARLEIELSEIIGRKVDLRIPGELSRYRGGAICSRMMRPASGTCSTRPGNH